MFASSRRGARARESRTFPGARLCVPSQSLARGAARFLRDVSIWHCTHARSFRTIYGISRSKRRSSHGCPSAPSFGGRPWPAGSSARTRPPRDHATFDSNPLTPRVGPTIPYWPFSTSWRRRRRASNRGSFSSQGSNRAGTRSSPKMAVPARFFRLSTYGRALSRASKGRSNSGSPSISKLPSIRPRIGSDAAGASVCYEPVTTARRGKTRACSKRLRRDGPD